MYPATSTPPVIAERMIQMVGLEQNKFYLEPSAGNGDLALCMLRHSPNITCVELNGQCCDFLIHLGFDPIKADFLRWEPDRLYDGVLMCPPKNAIPHVEKAIQCLAPSGKLVALVREDSEGLDKFHKYYTPIEDIQFHINMQPIRSGLIYVA